MRCVPPFYSSRLRDGEVPALMCACVGSVSRCAALGRRAVARAVDFAEEHSTNAHAVGRYGALAVPGRDRARVAESGEASMTIAGAREMKRHREDFAVRG